MEIGTYLCGSCAASGISNLSGSGSPLKAMQDFCKMELGAKNGKFGPVSYGKLAAFYVFVAGPEVKLGQPGSSHHSKPWTKYGTEFAAFIEENNLGTVATLGQKLNLKHHASTTCQVWLWSPDQKRMEEWWKQEGTPKPVPTPEAPIPVIGPVAAVPVAEYVGVVNGVVNEPAFLGAFNAAVAQMEVKKPKRKYIRKPKPAPVHYVEPDEAEVWFGFGEPGEADEQDEDGMGDLG